MAIPRMEEDVEVISKLGDVPGSENGLSPQSLKERFDLAAVRIKNYINTILIPGIESSVNEDSLLSQIGKALGQKLSLTGGTMTGAINMNGRSLYNIKTPTQDTEAVHKKYVDDATATANKYTDEKHKEFTVTLPANGWTIADGGAYWQTIAVEGILETDNPHWGIVYSHDERFFAEKESYALVDMLVTVNGSAIFVCVEGKPEADMMIQMEVNR